MSGTAPGTPAAQRTMGGGQAGGKKAHAHPHAHLALTSPLATEKHMVMPRASAGGSGSGTSSPVPPAEMTLCEEAARRVVEDRHQQDKDKQVLRLGSWKHTLHFANAHGTSSIWWRIPNFSKLAERKVYSDTRAVHGHPWRLLLFPRGNRVEWLSLYLDVADAAELVPSWCRYARFTLAVVNQRDPDTTVEKSTHHEFNTREPDWGFTMFVSLQQVNDPRYGFLVDDTLIVKVDILEAHDGPAPVGANAHDDAVEVVDAFDDEADVDIVGNELVEAVAAA